MTCVIFYCGAAASDVRPDAMRDLASRRHVKSRSESEPILLLLGFDSQGSANVFGGQHAGRVLHQTVEVVPRQLETLVLDGVEGKSPLEQFLHALLARDWIVGEVLTGPRVFSERGGVCDAVSCDHS